MNEHAKNKQGAPALSRTYAFVDCKQRPLGLLISLSTITEIDLLLRHIYRLDIRADVKSDVTATSGSTQTAMKAV